MKRFLLILGACLLGIGVCDAVAHAAITIQTDLQLAQTYWAIEQPNLTPPCPVTVTETNMVASIGNNGAAIAPNDTWAETAIGGCTINLSPTAWTYAQATIPQEEWETCAMIAHEYGHTLDLADTSTIPIMANAWNGKADPLCIQQVYGWAHTPHTDREWLTVHHQDHRHYKGIAP